MTTRIFSDILAQGIRAGQVPERTKQARDWYANTARNYGSTVRQGGAQAGRIDYLRINERKFINEDQSRLTTKILPGNMYMAMYQAKWADELPYWDRFPIFLPFRVQGDRFWSLNLHYLPYNLRAVLMDQLHQYASNNNYDETTKLKFNYQILKAASRNKYYSVCVKQYLFAQMRSQFAYIYPSEWTTAVFLPVEKFSKNKAQVWSDIKKKVR